jgi:hypothetical protein
VAALLLAAGGFLAAKEVTVKLASSKPKQKRSKDVL